MTTEPFDPRAIRTWPLAERKSMLAIEQIAADPDAAAFQPALAGPVEQLAAAIRTARKQHASVMLCYGAHLVKNGAGPLVNRLVESGWVTHAATHGAGIIHDWEFAHAGRSSESVRENAPMGRFGSWDETGRFLNLAALLGAADDIGWGQAIGRMIETDCLALPDPAELARLIAAEPAHPLAAARADLLAVMTAHNIPPGPMTVDHPHKQFSIPAACVRAQVPFTVHPGIGYDIITNHPLFHGGAIGRASGTDARLFTRSCMDLTGGAYLSIGSAIMSPQVFEKSFSLANNLRASAGQDIIAGHHIAVVDIQDGGGWDWSAGEPPADHPAYYLRFCKSFHRMGGRVQYIQADNRALLESLVATLQTESADTNGSGE
jgi:hypothetical protein